MAYTNSNDPNCPNCNKSGLAILPVRYAVVPSAIACSVPAHMGNKVTNIPLAHHKYALRTLRQGFIYILHEKHPRGSQIKWEVYSVSIRGTLWKQPSPGAIVPMSEDPACSRTGHNIPASVIAIDSPEKCGKIWMAFSEHEWSEETFKQYESDAKMRDRRMQTFLPATWISAGGYRHGLPATKENVEQVIEYQDDFAPSSLVGGEVGRLSKPDGTFNLEQLKKETTRHPMAMRKGQSESLVAAMNKVGERPGKKTHTPIILALWDAVGMTHELNGFRNDAAGRIEQYNEERALELSALASIEGMKLALEEKADSTARERANAGVFDWSPADTETRLANVAKYRPGDAKFSARQADLCARWERDSLEKVPSNIAFERDLYTRLPEHEWQKKMAWIDQAAKRATSERNPFSGKSPVELRQEHADELAKEAVADVWPKYEKLLRKDASGKFVHQLFKEKHQHFVSWADKLVDERTDDLIKWLESKALLDALTEFHPNNIRDGVAFDDKVGTAVFGMNSSIRGKAKIDAWIKEMKATEANLVWRAIALNSEQAMQDLNEALADAERHKNDRTLASALNWLNYGNKFLKAFADTYKKALSVENANTKARSTSGSSAFGVKLKGINTHGYDAMMMTAGDRAFGHVRITALTDHASEKIIQHIFCIRSFVSPLDSLRMISVQAKNEELARKQRLQRLRTAKGLASGWSPAIRTAQTELLTQEWEKFKADGTDTASRALKDSRVAVLVMLIEGSNFAKLIADCQMKGDAKSWWLLLASGTTITGALFDIASIPAKNIFGADSWSHQRIKGMGGILSASATAIMAVVDANEARKARAQGQHLVAGLYGLKSVVGAANAALTVATSFTYAAPAISRITGNAALGSAARVIGLRAAAIVGARILFMAAGAWLTIGLFGIQVFIWWFADDELQLWCSLSVFGNRSTAQKAFKTQAEQNEALHKALMDVGLVYD